MMAEFPLSGDIRLVTLGLEFVIVALCLQIAGIFLWKYLKARREHELSRIYLLWAIYFIAFGGMWGIYLKSDYYTESVSGRALFLSAGYIWMNVFLLIFAFILESFEEFRFGGRLKHIFSLLFGITLAILVTTTIISPEMSQSLSFLVILPTGILLLRYCFLIYRRLRATQKTQAIILFLAVIAKYGGYLLTSDTAMDFLTPNIRIYGDLVIITGIILSAIFFNRVPSIEEFTWYSLIENLFVVEAGGLAMYHKIFPGASQNEDGATESNQQQLITGAFTSLKYVLEAIVEKGSQLKILAQEDKTFLIEYGSKLTFVMMVQKALPSHRQLLLRFTHEFEDTFGPLLNDWNGDLNLFQTADLITDRIFQPPK